METNRERPSPAESPLARLESRLSQAKVAATSPKGIVKVVYNGHGDGLSMDLKPGSKQRFESETMAGFVTAALRAADRAVDALYQHAAGDLETDGVSLAEWRASRPTAEMDVATCFGRRTA